MGRIVTIIGTRPEIVKMAPVVKALDRLDHDHVLVHSGQHYDLMMDRIFFRDMQLREPDEQFELKEQPPHLQVATTMRQVADATKGADLVIVHGDTNTTVAGALLARKQDRALAHVEAGIRSFDKKMPEEINRIDAGRSPVHPRTRRGRDVREDCAGRPSGGLLSLPWALRQVAGGPGTSDQARDGTHGHGRQRPGSGRRRWPEAARLEARLGEPLRR